MAGADRIELRGLRLSGIVGVLPHEQAQPQPLEIDLDLVVDLDDAERSDDLADTVDYGAVCAAIERVVDASRFALLEALGGAIAAAALEVDRRVGSVVVSVRKLRPPVAQQLATSGVTLTRTRTDS